jgi:cytidyltransferase-like protein
MAKIHRKVMVSGKFDPVHHGHIDHIKKAAELGDYLLIVMHRDEGIIAAKGKCNVPLWARMILVQGIIDFYGINGHIVLSRDDDGTCVRTILYHKPDIYAKGGDRTPGNMLLAEVEACKQVGCEVRYGIGDLLASSSKMMGCNCESSDCCSASG